MKPNKFVNDVVNGYLSRDGTVAGARVRLVYFEGSKRDNQASKETGNISFQVFRVGSDITQESLSLSNDVFGKESDGLRNDCQGCCESDFESRDDGSNDLVDSIHPGDDGVERIRNVGGPGGKSTSGNLGALLTEVSFAKSWLKMVLMPLMAMSRVPETPDTRSAI